MYYTYIIQRSRILKFNNNSIYNEVYSTNTKLLSRRLHKFNERIGAYEKGGLVSDLISTLHLSSRLRSSLGFHSISVPVSVSIAPTSVASSPLSHTPIHPLPSAAVIHQFSRIFSPSSPIENLTSRRTNFHFTPA